MTYFQNSEFQCTCGACPVRAPDATLLTLLNTLRASYGKPIYITSGWRCDAQNKKAGGAPNSSHLTGQAADILVTGSRDRYYLLFHIIGLFKRIGIGTTFIHVDTDPTKDQEVIWLYGSH